MNSLNQSNRLNVTEITIGMAVGAWSDSWKRNRSWGEYLGDGWDKWRENWNVEELSGGKNDWGDISWMRSDRQMYVDLGMI
jgi:hypothetical protein